MKIKFVESIAGKDYLFGAGEVIDLPTSDAEYFVRVKVAEKVDEEPVQKPVTVQQVRKTTKRPVKR